MLEHIMSGFILRRWVVHAVILVPLCFTFLLADHAGSNRSYAGAMGRGSLSPTDQKCVDCHRKHSPALVMEWERSRHGAMGVSCLDCHKAEKIDIDAWNHEGSWVSALVTPKDCAQCHDREYEEFTKSHHARAGQILASLDNVLAEKVAGMPGNNADAVNGCWQCHGSMVKFLRDKNGN